MSLSMMSNQIKSVFICIAPFYKQCPCPHYCPNSQNCPQTNLKILNVSKTTQPKSFRDLQLQLQNDRENFLFQKYILPILIYSLFVSSTRHSINDTVNIPCDLNYCQVDTFYRLMPANKTCVYCKETCNERHAIIQGSHGDYTDIWQFQEYQKKSCKKLHVIYVAQNAY